MSSCNNCINGRICDTPTLYKFIANVWCENYKLAGICDGNTCTITNESTCCGDCRMLSTCDGDNLCNAITSGGLIAGQHYSCDNYVLIEEVVV